MPVKIPFRGPCMHDVVVSRRRPPLLSAPPFETAEEEPARGLGRGAAPRPETAVVLCCACEVGDWKKRRAEAGWQKLPQAQEKTGGQRPGGDTSTAIPVFTK